MNLITDSNSIIKQQVVVPGHLSSTIVCPVLKSIPYCIYDDVSVFCAYIKI